MIEIKEPGRGVLLRAYRDNIRQYYRTRFINVDFNVPRKEFGISTDPSRKITNRYVTFKDVRDLNTFLREKAPFFISYSVSDWKYPTESEVEAKIHISSELVFDFDDDEFIEYAKSDLVVCGDNVVEVKELLLRGENPLFCRETNSESKIIPIPSYERWEAVRTKALELVDLLVSDFPVDYDDITLNYSGKRGIHVHVKTNIFDNKDVDIVKRMKEQIASYISLSAFNPDGLFEIQHGRLSGPTIGINKQIDKIIERIISLVNGSFDRVASLVSDSNVRSEFLNYARHRGTLKFLESIQNGDYGPSKLYKAWRSIFIAVARMISLPIDVQTTVDVNRLIRLPDSIHGTTGLIAKRISIDEVDKFDPFRDAVALSKKPNVKLKVKYVPQFEFNGVDYGPYENEEVTLPFNVATYLIGVFDGWTNVVGGDDGVG